MLSAVQRVLGRNSVFSPVFIIKLSDIGISGRFRLALDRNGPSLMKATASFASRQLSVRTGAKTSMPWEKIPVAFRLKTS